MREFEYTVIDPMGFHARPASRIFMETRKFQCSIVAFCDGETADLKDLMSIMALGVRAGVNITFRFDGTDEEEACKAIMELVNEF